MPRPIKRTPLFHPEAATRPNGGRISHAHPVGRLCFA